MENEPKKKHFESLLREFTQDSLGREPEKNGHPYPGSQLPDEVEYPYFEEEEEVGLSEELDHLILMHREAHFGGDFAIMLDYYRSNGIGVYPEIDIDRIAYLAKTEEEMGQNLAPLLLTAPEAEKVGRAKKLYQQLKAVYDVEEQNSIPRLIADLILTEEPEPALEAEAVIEQGKKIVPELIKLIGIDDLYDPLFPGYGLAPSLAIYCLGQIHDPAAVIPIFETLGHEIEFEEETILEALSSLGNPAKEFLLKTIKSRPLSKDNQNAAFALTAFTSDPEVPTKALEELGTNKGYADPLFALYLLCSCTELKDPEEKKNLFALTQNPKVPQEIRAEIKNICSDWGLQ